MLSRSSTQGILFIGFLFLTACGGLQQLPSSRTKSTPASSAEIIRAAKAYLGSSYAYGGTSRTKGFDCSGLTYTVFKENGILLKRRSEDQYTQGKKVATQDARVGDLIFFKKGGRIFHVGIISRIKSGQIYMIHSSTSKGVIEQTIQNSYYWENKIAGVRRLQQN